MDELQVFLRVVSKAQRCWAKRIAAQEAKVRRFMIIEDNYRKKLRKSVLRSTNEQLKYLVNTDLLGSVEVRLPPRSAFHTLRIPGRQISGFSVFVMARLHASPASLSDVSQLGFIAQLLGAWEILPPSTKGQYEAYAESMRSDVGANCGSNDEDQSPAKLARQKQGDGDDDDATWESHAYRCFLREGRRQLEVSLTSFNEADWLAIAPKEWNNFTLRQKRCFM